ncbi:hypothetical protein [Variovorax sp. PMC12]|uniref:hypothetical protein n=1 Tax=Variovorax sp. PMC12 TaxID=2126319 RepID=UPI00131D30CA|nr:hypothetical protein [Variovorax sp. PMC12]
MSITCILLILDKYTVLRMIESEGNIPAQFHMHQPKQIFDYHVFIARLQKLVDQVAETPQDQRHAKSEWFQMWRLEASDLLKRAQNLHDRSEVASGLPVRDFGKSSGPPYSRQHFREDMDATLREFKLIIKNYEDFGAPMESKSSSASTTTRTLPDEKLPSGPAQPHVPVTPTSPAVPAMPSVPADGELTIAWLIHKMPLPWWAYIFSAGAALVAVAFFVGREWESYQQQKSRTAQVQPDPTPRPAPSAAPSEALPAASVETAPRATSPEYRTPTAAPLPQVGTGSKPQ